LLSNAPDNVTLYSNEVTSIAALVVECVSNMSYEQYIKDKILKSLNIDINKTDFQLSDL